MKSKKIRIGIDLDGVIIGKPPFVPKKIIEYLYRAHPKRGLSYRYPKHRPEIFIRRFSHLYFFRPPIKENVKLIKKLSKDKRYKLFAISSRYSFLKDRTFTWLEKNGLREVFEEVHLNTSDLQPHKFKEEKIRKLKIDVFFEDDEKIISYVKHHTKKVAVNFVGKEKNGNINKLLKA